MGDTADVVIIGGAVMGSAVADAIAGRGLDGSIVVVERDPSYHGASTGRSAGGVRHQFSTPENIHLSRATVEVLRDLEREFGPGSDLGFREQGYLILASEAGRGVLERNAAIQRSHGCETHLLDAAALAQRFPWLSTGGVAAGSFGARGEGWLDPVGLMGLLKARARSRGVEYLHDEARGIERDGAGRARAVLLGSGRRLACSTLIIAAGPQSGAVAALAGVALPVEPRKRYVYVFDCRDKPPALAAAPLTVDPSGVWFRPEGQVFIGGVSPEEDGEPPVGDLDHIDHELFEERVWPILAARVPAFEAIKLQRAWAGYYDYNTLDQNAIIGRHPTVDNLIFCTGFSGHGLQQAIGAGRAVAELVVDGGFVGLDLTRFGYGRIARGEPLLELNVI